MGLEEVYWEVTGDCRGHKATGELEEVYWEFTGDYRGHKQLREASGDCSQPSGTLLTVW